MSLDDNLDEIELQDGRPEPYPWTNLNDWVAVSGISSIAVHIYWIMRGHLYHVRGDVAVNKLRMDTIAAMLGKSRGDKITKYVTELVTVGALSRELVGMPARNVYKVHKVPPPGYTGPVSFAEWHKIRKLALSQLSAVAPERGEQAPADLDEQANEQVSPDAPKQGEQDAPESGQQEKPQVSADTPERGEQGPVNPDRGVLVDPDPGHIEVVRGLEVVEPHPPTPPGDRPAVASDVVEAATGGGEDSPSDTPSDSEALRAIVADIHAIRPTWKPHAIRRALLDAQAAGRDPLHTVAALTALALDHDGAAYDETTSPARLNAYEGPWWADTVPKPPPVPAAAPRPRGPRCERHWGEPAGGCALCPLDNQRPDDPLPAGAGRDLARQTAASAKPPTPRRATVGA